MVLYEHRVEAALFNHMATQPWSFINAAMDEMGFWPGTVRFLGATPIFRRIHRRCYVVVDLLVLPCEHSRVIGRVEIRTIPDWDEETGYIDLETIEPETVYIPYVRRFVSDFPWRNFSITGQIYESVLRHLITKPRSVLSWPLTLPEDQRWRLRLWE